jgi:ankyrin repeat protein
MDNKKHGFFYIAIIGVLISLVGCGSAPTIYSEIAAGNEESAMKLIQKRTGIDERNHIGNTPLHLASIEGNERIAKELVKYGADINARNFDGRTPIMLALVNGHIDLAKFYIERGAKLKTNYKKTNVLLDAAASGDTDMVEFILENGFDITTVDRMKNTALHVAAKQGDKDMVSFLINKGANLDARTEFGWTAMHYAAQKGHNDIIDLLLSSGAQPVDVEANGLGAFTTASIYEVLAKHHHSDNRLNKAKMAYENAARFYSKAADHYKHYLEDVSTQISHQQLKNFLALVVGATVTQIGPGTTFPTPSGGTTTLYAPAVFPLENSGSLEKLQEYFEQREQEARASAQRCMDALNQL